MQQDLLLKSYNYDLPREKIAQHPAERRDESKLLVFNRHSGGIEHKHFCNIIELIDPGDILVINNTKVFPARLLGKKESGGKVEIFLLEYPLAADNDKQNQEWMTATATALLKSSKRPRPGTKISISEELFCKVINWSGNGKAQVELLFQSEYDLTELLLQYGQVPLPPYIARENGTTSHDRDRYQTVYASHTGAVAAPTAGLHFTKPLLKRLEEKRVKIATITLHVGYGTFAPVRAERINDHSIHEEYVHISEQAAELVNRTKASGGKVWAVGTTTVRALEFCAKQHGKCTSLDAWCDLYITPGYRFAIIDKLVTNFHLPQSSLLFLVAALCGREQLMNAYREAIENDYRFYSYGDAMVII